MQHKVLQNGPACLYSIEYKHAMFAVKRTPQFDAWLDGLRDGTTPRRLALRLRKAQLGNLGDIQPVGAGVLEMREHFGPGWRMYSVQRGAVPVVISGGGSKATQQADITAAQALASILED